jgi:hypothetical protein
VAENIHEATYCSVWRSDDVHFAMIRFDPAQSVTVGDHAVPGAIRLEVSRIRVGHRMGKDECAQVRYLCGPPIMFHTQHAVDGAFQAVRASGASRLDSRLCLCRPDDPGGELVVRLQTWPAVGLYLGPSGWVLLARFVCRHGLWTSPYSANIPRRDASRRLKFREYLAAQSRQLDAERSVNHPVASSLALSINSFSSCLLQPDASPSASRGGAPSRQMERA